MGLPLPWMGSLFAANLKHCGSSHCCCSVVKPCPTLAQNNLRLSKVQGKYHLYCSPKNQHRALFLCCKWWPLFLYSLSALYRLVPYIHFRILTSGSGLSPDLKHLKLMSAYLFSLSIILEERKHDSISYCFLILFILKQRLVGYVN